MICLLAAGAHTHCNLIACLFPVLLAHAVFVADAYLLTLYSDCLLIKYCDIFKKYFHFNQKSHLIPIYLQYSTI